MRSARQIIAAPAVAEPAKPAYAAFIAGAGLIEPLSENLAIGTPVSGVVHELACAVGAKVAAGAPLLRLDDRPQKQAVLQAEAQLALVRQRFNRLKALPRPETLPPAEARSLRAETALADASDQRDRAEKAAVTGAVSVEELARRRFAVLTAQALLAEAQADFTQLKAGTWAADLEVAAAEVALAEAQVAAARVDVERQVITSPCAATVLRISIRPGEFAAAGGSATMILGDLTSLHVRVDLDEQDAWRLTPGAPGTATVRGNPSRSYVLDYVRVEPYVTPKKSLTGDSTERVDTRVLQVIYRIREPQGLFVGQQMDVQVQAQNQNLAAGNP